MPVFRSYEKYIDANRPFDENLLTLLNIEFERRETASLNKRIRNAGFPFNKPLSTFNFLPNLPNLDKDAVLSLATCGFIKNKSNICAIGPTGTGKSHLMIAIGIEALNRGYTVKFIRVSDLLLMMEEAKTEKRLGVLMKSLEKCDLLELDELGYIHLSTKRSQLLFDVIAKRCETGKSVYVTSNYTFSQWPSFLGNSVLTNAMVGKLTGASIILNMNGEDYRLYIKRQ
jgi:DNA replication protein DnaC